MKELIEKINELRNSKLAETVSKRLKEFESFKNKKNADWFSELCFCILTANSKAKTALAIQNELGAKGFACCSLNEVKNCIIRNKHRFHNNKSRFIVEARKHLNIKDKIQSLDEFEAREWLVNNIKGLGYKESSHFLRNTGSKNLAILDRHILNLMLENKMIDKIPKLNKKTYIETEKKLKPLADELKMSMAELDLYMWCLKTGEVLK